MSSCQPFTKKVVALKELSKFGLFQRKLRKILSRIGRMGPTKWHLKIFMLLSLWPGWLFML